MFDKLPACRGLSPSPNLPSLSQLKFPGFGKGTPETVVQLALPTYISTVRLRSTGFSFQTRDKLAACRTFF
jgi:hypothetical protein